MSQPKYYIIFTLKNQAILSFLKVRVVVNNKEIYPLPWNTPVLVAVEEDHPQIVLTDGFHFSRPRRLDFGGPGYFNFEVETPLSDWRLFKGGVVLSFLYIWASLSNFLLLKIVSFIPIIVALVQYYLYRRSFLRLRQIRMPRRL
ncbi:MAG: hypothetical protein NVV59_15045 [Chitinophagaceae bacterium]|nr:hypothetical protein [Chitinophagaceae bacterium]